MFRPPAAEVVAAFRRYVEDTPEAPRESRSSLQFGTQHLTAPSFRLVSRKAVLIEVLASASLATAVEELKKHAEWASPEEAELQEVLVALSGVLGDVPQRVVRLGVRAVPLHYAIATLAGLPAGWRDAQLEAVRQILEPLRVGGEYRTARLRVPAENGEPDADAHDWLAASFHWSGTASGRLTYLRAEAGKGKSTAFAELVLDRLTRNDGPLPLLVRLRNLPRGAGASWHTIAASLGVLGDDAATLARAVRSGLVVLLLDGLDEVSGRYDPTVIQEIVAAVSAQTFGPDSLLALSGRTTEGLLLDPARAYQRSLELPDTSGAEFRRYVGQVIDKTVPEWPKLAAELPEPPADAGPLVERPLTDADRDHVLRWVLYCFNDFGKDRSLFFVQSLACLARDRQLRGNKPIYHHQPGSAPKVAECGLYDACILAASLACVRERDKIAAEARPIFTTSRQLAAVTWFSVLASADEVWRIAAPTPNQILAEIFALDTVNQPDEFNSIIRQMQKHALLYSVGGGFSGGEWRPAFLSDWVRAALLVRAWEQRGSPSAPLAGLVVSGVVTAQRARIAYESVFPDWLARSGAGQLADLATALVAAANLDSPEACGNYWSLLQGLPDDTRAQVAAKPARVVEYTDLSGREFEGLDFGHEFSSNLAFFADTSFSDCEFANCRFSQCDFTHASFVNCQFRASHFVKCDGPVSFEACVFTDCEFEDIASQELPAWLFGDCEFRGTSIIGQASGPCSERYRPIVEFQGCTSDGDPLRVLVGPELGRDARRFTGLITATVANSDPSLNCFRRLIRPFFPSHVGPSGARQARDYIRSSALGRGATPYGTPNATQLLAFLTAERFTSGGRKGHLYAPWCEVGGCTRPELRAEFSSFLQDERSQSATVRRVVEKIRQAARW